MLEVSLLDEFIPDGLGKLIRRRGGDDAGIAAASQRPSGEKATQLILSLWPRNSRSSLPVANCQRRITLSKQAPGKVLPSWLKAK